MKRKQLLSNKECLDRNAFVRKVLPMLALLLLAITLGIVASKNTYTPLVENAILAVATLLFFTSYTYTILLFIKRLRYLEMGAWHVIAFHIPPLTFYILFLLFTKASSR